MNAITTPSPGDRRQPIGPNSGVSAQPSTEREVFQRSLHGIHGQTGLPVVDPESLLGALKEPEGAMSLASLLGTFITVDQQLISDTIRGTAREVADVAEILRMDREQEFCAKHLAALHNVGMVNLSIPERLGGGGQSYTTEALAVLTLAEIDAGLAAAYATNPLALKPILIAGTEEQKLRLVKPTVESGKLASYCQTEPGAGSDVANLSSSITPDGQDFILNGSKIWATNGAKADLLLVACRLAGTKGRNGITIVAVPRDTAGVTVVSSEDKLGQRLSNAAALAFQDVRIPRENVIGEPGQGFGILMQTLGMARPNVAAIGLGIMLRAIDLGYNAVKGREQFGRSVTENQGVQFPLAEAYMKATSGLLMMMQATKAHDLGLPNAHILASMAKLQTSEDARVVTLAMADLHGGTGYSREAEISKLVRDVNVLTVYEGTNNIQRGILYKALAAKYK